MSKWFGWRKEHLDLQRPTPNGECRKYVCRPDSDRDAYKHSYGDADQYTDGNAYEYTYEHSNGYADEYTHGDAYTNAYRYTHAFKYAPVSDL